MINNTILKPMLKLYNTIGPIMFLSLNLTLGEISEKIKDIQYEKEAQK